MQSPPSTPPRRIAHIAVPIAIFVLAFAATTWGLRHSLPSGDGELLTAKLALFAEQDAERPFDVVFLGSSRIYHGVVPEVFDQRMAELGYPVRSFNLAVTGQMVEGAFAALRSLANHDPTKLRYVFVDPEDPELMLGQVRRSMRGIIPQYDVSSSELVLDYIWHSDLKLLDKWDRSTEVLRACAYDTTNVGRGLGWLDETLGRATSAEDIVFRVGPRADGWRAKDVKPKPPSIAAHRAFLEAPANWHGIIATLKAARPHSDPLHSRAIPLITRIEDLAREMGVEPIFFISPSKAYQGQLQQAKQRGLITNLFRFNDPVAYSELYAMDARWEAAHLSAEGARRFSTALANRFAEHLSSLKEEQQ